MLQEIQERPNLMRPISIAVAVIFLFVSIIASTESVSAASKLKVTITKKTIFVGQTVKVKANKNVKWSVSEKKVAKLTKVKKKTVTVKGLKAGTTYIKAKSGNKTKKIKIVVKAKPKKLTLKSTDKEIGLGKYCMVSAKYGKKSISAKKLSFSSSDKSVAVVGSDGLVYGLSPGIVTITAKLKSDKTVKAKVKISVIASKAGTLTLSVDMSDESRYPAGETVKVWLPVPQNDDYQMISSLSFEAPGAKTAKITKDSAGGKQLYIEWDQDTAPAERKATLSYYVYRRAVINDGDIASKEKGKIDKTKFEYELKETRWSGSLTSGIVKQTADKIVAKAGAKTVYDKAFAIYNWVCDNITRIDDKNVIFGDVVSMLEGKRPAGSCMDVNSIFVALCRAEGIPARNLFGLRFAPKAGQKIGPNCRSEFYLPGYGWVVADPALAIKQSWGHESEYIGKGAPNAATWKGIKNKFWGSAEENWICMNTGRDIILTPKQGVVPGEYHEILNPDGTINLFMFPYGEHGGEYIECQKPAEFKYEYTFEEVDPTDCGC